MARPSRGWRAIGAMALACAMLTTSAARADEGTAGGPDESAAAHVERLEADATEDERALLEQARAALNAAAEPGRDEPARARAMDLAEQALALIEARRALRRARAEHDASEARREAARARRDRARARSEAAAGDRARAEAGLGPGAVEGRETPAGGEAR